MALGLFDRLAIPYEPVDIGHGTDGITLNFLAELLRYTQPKVIVEAGTYQGSFTLLAREVCPDAIIHTADIHEHQWHGDVRAAADFFLGDFEDMIRQWPPTFTTFIDFAFIDSGPAAGVPSEDGVRLRHYEAVKPYMTGGIIATHDTAKTDWGGAKEIIADASIQLNCGRGLSLRQV